MAIQSISHSHPPVLYREKASILVQNCIPKIQQMIEEFQVIMCSKNEKLAHRHEMSIVPTFQATDAKDAELANSYFQAGFSQENIRVILTNCKKGIRYTYPHSSEIYATLPRIYEQLGKNEKAHLSRLYLSIYQLKEENVNAAIETLNKCNLGQSEIVQTLNALSVQKMGLEKSSPFRTHILTKNQFLTAHEMILPPYPKSLQEFLNEACTIWPGRKRSETHLVVPLFPLFPLFQTENEEPQRLSYELLTKWGAVRGYLPKLKGIYGKDYFRWGVLTHNVIPGTRGKLLEAQIRSLPAGYSLPDVLDAAYALLWRRQCTETYYGLYNFFICKTPQSHYFFTGSTEHYPWDNISLNYWSDNVWSKPVWDKEFLQYIGLAGWREFRTDYTQGN